MNLKQDNKPNKLLAIAFGDLELPIAFIVLLIVLCFSTGGLMGWMFHVYVTNSLCYQDVMANVVPGGFNEDGTPRIHRYYEFVGRPDLRLSPGFVELEDGSIGIESRLIMDHVFIIHGDCEMNKGNPSMIENIK